MRVAALLPWLLVAVRPNAEDSIKCYTGEKGSAQADCAGGLCSIVRAEPPNADKVLQRGCGAGDLNFELGGKPVSLSDVCDMLGMAGEGGCMQNAHTDARLVKAATSKLDRVEKIAAKLVIGQVKSSRLCCCDTDGCNESFGQLERVYKSANRTLVQVVPRSAPSSTAVSAMVLSLALLVALTC